MLTNDDLIAFLATQRASEALAFYRDVLGLSFRSDDAFALVFETGGVTLRIQKVERHAPLPYTALGWKVANIQERARELAERGVRFERFQGLEQDAQGIWAAPSGARIAWFKDPDGNVLSLTQL